ncbi:type 1 glutamine amidotransferase domain-containing protein [Chromobacterium vaccinii]|uniref:type 1 glutamine amidotransferase domain-containing protein n=1 Tax=Chromobacterium vaccinii TaxID=1108595 RepID=UPI0019100B45|nr:type 1 glutamine amidotransferase domain-containing protein [Chromobacterium vaccinii]
MKKFLQARRKTGFEIKRLSGRGAGLGSVESSGKELVDIKAGFNLSMELGAHFNAYGICPEGKMARCTIMQKVLSVPIFNKPVQVAMSMPIMQTAAADAAPLVQEPSASAGKILMVMTNHDRYPSRTERTGLWLAELTHVYDALTEAGYAIDFASPNGGAVPLDPRSLGWPHADAAAKARLNDPAFMALLQSTRAVADIDPGAYRAIFYTGGHGTIWDFRNNADLNRVAESIYRSGGIVSAVCHGLAGLLDLQTEEGRPLLEGRRVTGFSNFEEALSGVKDQVPYQLQSEMEARGGRYEKAVMPFGSFALTDGRLITGQNPRSSKALAQALLAALRNEPAR